MDFFGFTIPSIVTDTAKVVTSVPKTITSTVGGIAVNAGAAITSIPKTITSTAGKAATDTIRSVASNPVKVVLSASPLSFVPGASQAAETAANVVVKSAKTALSTAALEKVKTTSATQDKNTVTSGGSSAASASLPAASAVSGGVDAVIGARDQAYADGFTQLFLSDTTAGKVAGAAQVAAPMAADVLLPLDVVNVANKLATGRGDELTTADYAYAALDTIGVLGSVFTFGGSYALTRALKASKLAKLGETVKTGAEMSKLSAIKGAFETIRSSAKMSEAAKTTVKTSGSGAKTAKYTQYLNRLKNTANAVKTNAAKTYSSLKSTRVPTTTVKGTNESTGTIADLSRRMSTLEDLKSTESAKITSALEDVQKSTSKSINDLTKSVSESLDAFGNLKTTGKTEGTLSKIGNAIKYGVIGGTVGSVGLAALQAFGTPVEETPTGGNEDNQNDLNADLDGNGIPDWLDALFGTESAADTGLPTNADTDEGYTDASYPDPLGLESGAQDVLSGLEDVPVVGDVATVANENGVALPVLLLGGLVVVGGAAYVLKKTKTGKQITARVSGAVSSAGKAAKKAVSA